MWYLNVTAVYASCLYRTFVSVCKLYDRGLCCGPKTIFIPPPPQKLFFFPLSQHVVFRLLLCPFCLNSSLFCIYFTSYFPFALFLYPFHFFLSSVLLFLINFSLFHIFPPNYIGWYPPPPREYFLYKDPCYIFSISSTKIIFPPSRSTKCKYLHLAPLFAFFLAPFYKFYYS